MLATKVAYFLTSLYDSCDVDAVRIFGSCGPVYSLEPQCCVRLHGTIRLSTLSPRRDLQCPTGSAKKCPPLLSTRGRESSEQPCREVPSTCSSSREYPGHRQILPA